MSAAFKGVVLTEAGAKGPINLSIDDRGSVTGTLKIGKAPDWAGTGFSGVRSGSRFTAKGRNRRTSSTGKTYDLEVLIEGDITDEGKAVDGIVGAWLNVPEIERGETMPAPWSFNATLSGGRPVESARPSSAELGGQLQDAELPEAPEVPTEEPTWWDRTPVWLKGVGIGGAALGGLAIIRKLRGR